MVQEVNGIIRFPQTSDLIGSVVLFIILAKSLKIISQFKMIVYATLCMFCLLFISNVRMVTLISIIILIYFFYSLQLNRKSSYIKIICSILIIIGICIITIQFGLIERFIGVGQQQASVFYRFNVIDYYRNHFLDNLIFGFGYSSSVKTLYNYTDIGMLGFIYRYGIIGLMWVISIILYFYKGNKNSIINKTIFIYFLGMAISLSLFDPQRILYFPILFSIYTNFVDRSEIF
ncbi:O-antigen ligase family protein [Enterococcus casseliflavus]|uniref:O-antigen ligase family protein n=1 Tax=Enterococcus casseliflavus TaxID=37734 RepID=UPI003D0A0C73